MNKKSFFKVRVSGGVLSIKIGVATLANAANLCAHNSPFDGGSKEFLQVCRVTDPQVFAENVASCLQQGQGHEGGTPLTLMFDKAIEIAFKQGSDGVEYPK